MTARAASPHSRTPARALDVPLCGDIASMPSLVLSLNLKMGCRWSDVIVDQRWSATTFAYWDLEG